MKTLYIFAHYSDNFIKHNTTMRKLFLSAIFAIATMFATINAQEHNTTLSAQIYGYKGEMVYFDCVQTPLIHQEFYTNPGEEHLYQFSIDNTVCMLINGKTKLLMQPGDSLFVEMRYKGRNIDITFSGCDNAVRNNNFLQDIDNLKRDLRYKSQLLGCVALDIKPKERIDDSRTLLAKVNEMIANSQLDKDVANYILAGIESEAYLSFMEYPVMYASVRGTAVEEQEIGDYWSIMDGFEPRQDAASLSNPEYASLLMRYCFFANEKKAAATGENYRMPSRLESIYAEIAEFYTGAPRDFVLYNLLCNFIKNGQEIERADALYSDYKEKYNINKEYIHILDSILQ